MRTFFRVWFFSVLTVVCCRGAEPTAKPTEAYAQAVIAYVEAANREMVALHAKVEALAKNASDAGKVACAEISRQLDVCDELLERLTTANRSSFDAVKSAYERERALALKALDEAAKK